MSQSHQPRVTIGCPTCDAPLSRAIPRGPGLQPASDRQAPSRPNQRLNGLEAECHECGHTVELYYY